MVTILKKLAWQRKGDQTGSTPFSLNLLGDPPEEDCPILSALSDNLPKEGAPYSVILVGQPEGECPVLSISVRRPPEGNQAQTVLGL